MSRLLTHDNAVVLSYLAFGRPCRVSHCRELFRDPKVKFSGYKHPHPLDNDIIVRIQTAPGQTPAQAFQAAAMRLEAEFRVMKSKFAEEVARLRAESAEFE